MDQVTDVEAKGYYAEYIEKMSEKEAFAKILTGTREHTRVLLPWNEKLPSYHEGLVQEIRTEITDVYKELIKLRRENEALIYGDFEVVNKDKDRFVYKRVLGETEFMVDCNLGKDTKKAFRADGYERIFTTEGEHDILSSFEARIWKKQED